MFNNFNFSNTKKQFKVFKKIEFFEILCQSFLKTKTLNNLNLNSSQKDSKIEVVLNEFKIVEKFKNR